MSTNKLRTDVESILTHIPTDFGGGCSINKAYLLAFLIRRFDLKVTVDIGVYRGRSLFPQAIAHQSCTGGTAYGIDPWHKELAKEKDTDLRDVIDQWIEEIDFDEIYHDVDSLRSEFNLQPHCVLLRQSSRDAASFFDEHGLELDLVHIDGNHDTHIVMQDVELYAPKVKAEGFLILDDISWPSIQPAYDALMAKMSLIYQRREKQGDDYAVFWNSKSFLGGFQRRLMLTMTTR